MDKPALKIVIEGMHCGGCVRRVSAALAKLDGVEVERVEVGSAEVHYDPPATGAQEILDAITRIGFTASEG